MNLLDMEAALPDEALRLTRYDSEKRRAWRAFVKTAESIYEVSKCLCLLLLKNLCPFFCFSFFLFTFLVETYLVHSEPWIVLLISIVGQAKTGANRHIR